MALALAVNHVWQGRGLRLPRTVAWALTLLFVMACWVLFRSADFTTAGDMLLSMIGRHGVGRVSLDREFVAALIGGAAVALLGPTSQEAALAEAAAEAVAGDAGGCRTCVSAAAGRWPVAECLHLLPVLTPFLGAASSALAAGTAVLAVAVIYAFVVLVDPFDTLPLSPPADRVPVATQCALRVSRRWRARTSSTARSSARRPAGCCAPRC